MVAPILNTRACALLDHILNYEPCKVAMPRPHGIQRPMQGRVASLLLGVQRKDSPTELPRALQNDMTDMLVTLMRL